MVINLVMLLDVANSHPMVNTLRRALKMDLLKFVVLSVNVLEFLFHFLCLGVE